MLCVEATAQAKLVMETVKGCIESIDEILTIYDKFAEQIVPSEEFNETLVGLDKFQNYYSMESATLIGEIKTHIFYGIDAYFLASEMLYEWSGVVATHFKLFVSLFNGYDARRADAQKQLLIDMLDSGVVKMSAAQVALGNSSMAFNSADEIIPVLRKRIDHDFNVHRKSTTKPNSIRSKVAAVAIALHKFIFGKNSVEKKIVKKLVGFHDKLDEKIQEAMINIAITQKLLKMEIKHIANLKSQIQQTVTFVNLDGVPNLRDTVIESARNLIAKCEEFRKKYIKSMNRL